MWECSDPAHTFYAQRLVCRASMELAAAEAAYDELHKDAPYHDGTFTEWAKERSEDFPYHARDGVRFYVTNDDANPDDLFTFDPAARPVPMPRS